MKFYVAKMAQLFAFCVLPLVTSGCLATKGDFEQYQAAHKREVHEVAQATVGLVQGADPVQYVAVCDEAAKEGDAVVQNIGTKFDWVSLVELIVGISTGTSGLGVLGLHVYRNKTRATALANNSQPASGAA